MFAAHLKSIVLKKNNEKRKKVISLPDLKANCIRWFDQVLVILIL